MRSNWIIFQHASKQIKINNVVKIKKNKDIPSTPKCKLMFRKGNHSILETYWNEPIVLSKYKPKKSE